MQRSCRLFIAVPESGSNCRNAKAKLQEHSAQYKQCIPELIVTGTVQDRAADGGAYERCSVQWLSTPASWGFGWKCGTLIYYQGLRTRLFSDGRTHLRTVWGQPTTNFSNFRLMAKILLKKVFNDWPNCWHWETSSITHHKHQGLLLDPVTLLDSHRLHSPYIHCVSRTIL